ncbi:fructosamine kinase family protein [Rhodococcus sp. EPR-147]|uniref:fructosamine kinase family protein n=1 Tax=Rhodococcus sp. EPR-147 TaxID=1813676 RepID=UPI0009EEF76F|nr:fructosamine kinase family protein [Rhodococcus sp. EPR-147]
MTNAGADLAPCVVSAVVSGTSDTFVKRNPQAHPDFYAAEATGLGWLGEAGAPVVGVVGHGRAYIELERLVAARPTPAGAERFGRALAATHSAEAAGFGAPPVDADGVAFSGQLFIGSRPMSSTVHRSWGAFYAAERVLPFLRIAVDAGTVTPGEASVVESACGRIADGDFDDAEPPSRIHGDLWNGNVFWTDAGVVLIDPAAHGGHRETDLAMLALFGCPHLDVVVGGYETVQPLRAGWRERTALHQLHPLAVHAAGHGRSYGTALHAAAAAVVRL